MIIEQNNNNALHGRAFRSQELANAFRVWTKIGGDISMGSVLTALYVILGDSTRVEADSEEKASAVPYLPWIAKMISDRKEHLRSGHLNTLLELMLHESRWKTLLADTEQKYLFAGLILDQISRPVYLKRPETPPSISLLKEWTGKAPPEAAWTNVPVASEFLFGPTWSTLCGDDLPIPLAGNYSILLTTRPQFVFEEHAPVVTTTTTPLPTDFL